MTYPAWQELERWVKAGPPGKAYCTEVETVLNRITSQRDKAARYALALREMLGKHKYDRTEICYMDGRPRRGYCLGCGHDEDDVCASDCEVDALLNNKKKGD